MGRLIKENSLAIIASIVGALLVIIATAIFDMRKQIQKNATEISSLKVQVKVIDDLCCGEIGGNADGPVGNRTSGNDWSWGKK